MERDKLFQAGRCKRWGDQEVTTIHFVEMGYKGNRFLDRFLVLFGAGAIFSEVDRYIDRRCRELKGND
jgi:hypothetical protein